MSVLRVGFGKMDITPAHGCYLQGNPSVRIAQETADPLHVRCVTFEDQGLLVMLYFDLIQVPQTLAEPIRTYVSQHIGCPKEYVFVSATHTHTGPNIVNAQFPLDEEYRDTLKYAALQAARIAKNDLHPAQMFFAKDKLPGLSFIRRYLMKDGTVRTNPGRRNPDIVRPMSQADDDIQLLKITREGAGDIALVNFQCHPDVVKTRMPVPALSADYPGVVCNTLEHAIDGLDCMYCNGACGDLNHIDVNCPEWDKNGGMEHGLHMGRTIAGKILSMYTKARPIASGAVKAVERVIELPQKKPTPEEVADAQRIVDGYNAGNQDVIPEKPGSMEFITTLYEAKMRIRLSKSTGSTTIRLSAFRIGDFSVAGIPGEPFCQIGMDIKAASPFPHQFALGLTNGGQGYFPSQEAFSVNGYEARTSSYLPTVAKYLTDTAVELLHEMEDTND